jgi:Porin subfamily
VALVTEELDFSEILATKARRPAACLSGQDGGAYAIGIYFSRRIAKACVERVANRVAHGSNDRSMHKRPCRIFPISQTPIELSKNNIGSAARAIDSLDRAGSNVSEVGKMKMLKSVLLGSAAGLVAVTVGQAAELPVKAKPVEYVKVCNLYGVGFYYMPGTDMCLRIGGYVRMEFVAGDNGNVVSNPYNANYNNRTTSNLAVRWRGYIQTDAREQTAYGVARGYLSVGVATADTGTPSGESDGYGFSANRAFVQWAGFTAGMAVSFYDFYFPQRFSYKGFLPESDTADNGWWVWGYTASLGGGFSATLAAEERRSEQIIAQSTVGTIAGTGTLGSGASTGGGEYGGWQVPDTIANLRVDQSWGSAQVMGALHEVNAAYYATSVLVPSNGHPANAWGYALGAGLTLNFPALGPADVFSSQVNYTVGATKYLEQGTTFNYMMERGAGQSFGVQSDCVYGGSVAAGNATPCDLTTAVGFNAAYDHYYTSQWHQSLYVEAHKLIYDTQANAILCSLIGGGNGAGVGTAAVATSGCNNNWYEEGIGSRLQWDISKTLYVGLEVDVQHQKSATTFNGLLTSPITLSSGGALFVSNENNVAVTFRVQKEFAPPEK